MVEHFLPIFKDIIVNKSNKKSKQEFLLRSLLAECKKNLEIFKVLKKSN